MSSAAERIAIAANYGFAIAFDNEVRARVQVLPIVSVWHLRLYDVVISDPFSCDKLAFI